jgi:Protein of unknown function (DUF4238)
MQTFRTRDYREFQNDIARQLRASYGKLFEPTDTRTVERCSKPTLPIIPPLTDVTTLQHARTMFDVPFIEKVMTILFKHIWLVGENNTSQPLFTSDAPVTRYSHAKPFQGSGFASPGVEILLPLSSRHILILLDRPYFKRSKFLTDGIVQQLVPDQVTHFNASQVRESYRQIYCREEQFDLARDYIEHYPDVCDPYQQRVSANE